MRALRQSFGLVLTLVILTGCGGGGGAAGSASATGSSPPPTANDTASDSPPTISGTPAATVTAGSAYSFTPTASDPNGQTLHFSATNLPSWASINSQTGAVTGTPTSSSVGTFSNIVISVSDGTLSASLPAFSITVNAAAPAGGGSGGTTTGSATVSWVPPTTNADGSPLTNLAGYHIYYGTNPAALTQSVQISSAAAVSYVVTNLASGTWYFTVTAYTTSGTESAPSGIASKTI